MRIIGWMLVLGSLLFGATAWEYDVDKASYYIFTALTGVVMMAMGVILLHRPHPHHPRYRKQRRRVRRSLPPMREVDLDEEGEGFFGTLERGSVEGVGIILIGPGAEDGSRGFFGSILGGPNQDC